MRFNEYYQKQNEFDAIKPSEIFEVIDLSTMTESEIQQDFMMPCYGQSKNAQIVESSIADQAEQSLDKATDGSGGDLVPIKSSDGKTRFKIGNEKVKAVIFSMTTAYECPADKKGMCMSSEACYAKRDEHIRPDTFLNRKKQAVYWDGVTVDQFVEDFLGAVVPEYKKVYGQRDDPSEYIGLTPDDATDKVKDARDVRAKGIESGEFKGTKTDPFVKDPSSEKITGKDKTTWLRAMTTPVKFFRFNESGDFRSQEDVSKMSEIAKQLKDKLGIITYGYTARKDLSFGGVNFICKGSGYPKLTSDGHCIVFPEREDVPKGYFGCAAVEQHVTCLLGCRACLTSTTNVAFRQHSGAGLVVDKVVCDRYKKVYDPEFKANNDFYIIKNTKSGRKAYYTKAEKWLAADTPKGALKGKDILFNGKLFGTTEEADEFVSSTLSDVDGVEVGSFVDMAKARDERQEALVRQRKLDPLKGRVTPGSVGVRD